MLKLFGCLSRGNMRLYNCERIRAQVYVILRMIIFENFNFLFYQMNKMNMNNELNKAIISKWDLMTDQNILDLNSFSTTLI